MKKKAKKKFFRCMDCNKLALKGRYIPVDYIFEGYGKEKVKVCNPCAAEVPHGA